jgi:hypothetical protein
MMKDLRVSAAGVLQCVREDGEADTIEVAGQVGAAVRRQLPSRIPARGDDQAQVRPRPLEHRVVDLHGKAVALQEPFYSSHIAPLNARITQWPADHQGGG